MDNIKINKNINENENIIYLINNNIDLDTIERIVKKKNELTIVEKYYLSIFYKNKINTTNNEHLKKKYLYISFNYLDSINFNCLEYINYKNIYIEDYIPNNKYLNNKDIIEWYGIYDYADICLKIGLNDKTEKILKEMFNNVEIRNDKEKYEKIQKLRLELLNNNNIKNNSEIYPKNKIKIINNLKSSINTNIACFILHTETFDSLCLSINSFINSCEDIYLINNWICIGNKILETQEIKIKKMYPFIHFYFSERNIVEHINNIKNIIDEKYIIYFEDNWKFIKKQEYIIPALNIFENFDKNKISYIDENINENIDNKKVGQVLFNINYLSKLELTSGGKFCKLVDNLTLIIDDLNNKIDYREKNFFNSFTFRPCIFLKEILISNILENCLLYEKIFGIEYSKKNYISCFYDEITCIKNIEYESETNSDIDNITDTKFKYFNNLNEYIQDDEYIFLENADVDIFSEKIIDNPNIQIIRNKSNVQYLNIAKKNNYLYFNTNGYFNKEYNNKLVKIKNNNDKIKIPGTYLRKDIFEKYFNDLIVEIK